MFADDSGVKHFDRKFVASNLQNLLRCPKCSKCYTYSYSKNQGDESYRPFLLPCGHNLCESCVWSNHQDLKCAVCQTPASPTIKSKDPAKKSSANVRDYYELNYHVLGETSSLSYFRRFASETTNKSLTLSSISEEVVQATKCSECGNAIANGECRQCNASYCRRCFEAVHNHSRVLKSHVFQITQESHSRKGLRVGKQFFTLPTKNECHQHRMLKNIFCLNCKRTNCPACISVLHRGHRTKSLLDMVSKIGNIVSVSDTMISTYT